MRTITLNDGREFGTNNRDGGVFCRRRDGAWQQWNGNSQTPTFQTRRQFKQWLTRHHDGFTGTRIVESRGWGD